MLLNFTVNGFPRGVKEALELQKKPGPMLSVLQPVDGLKAK
jgi:ACT domain-containing protein